MTSSKKGILVLCCFILVTVAVLLVTVFSVYKLYNVYNRDNTGDEYAGQDNQEPIDPVIEDNGDDTEDEDNDQDNQEPADPVIEDNGDDTEDEDNDQDNQEPIDPVIEDNGDDTEDEDNDQDNQEPADPVIEDNGDDTEDEDNDQDNQEPIDPVIDLPAKVMYVVAPHPDDEFMAWSLIENTPDTHKVFVMLTRGEQTYYCDSPAYDARYGATRPDPWPTGRWSPSCERARINSFFGFMEAMGAADDGLPESYDSLGVLDPFVDGAQITCRRDSLDSGTGECITDLTAEVWTSSHATIVWFNLGDGDLTAREVRWAISTVLSNKDALGIDSRLSDSGILGASYWNGLGYSGCSAYANSDHRAVHIALKTTDFEVGWQAAPTCGADPEAVMKVSVTESGYLRAFGKPPDSALGAFFVNYGWLSGGEKYGHPDDPHGQHTNFHRHQTFWIRH